MSILDSEFILWVYVWLGSFILTTLMVSIHNKFFVTCNGCFLDLIDVAKYSIYVIIGPLGFIMIFVEYLFYAVLFMVAYILTISKSINIKKGIMWLINIK